MALAPEAMRLILSRKGFDSRLPGGGAPSPIFPDGSMIALPIPDKNSPIRYSDLTWNSRNIGDLVERLTRGRIRRDFRAHLDPDLREGILGRQDGWRAALGQSGASQSHLRNQGVAPGDIFLFWGLFRPVDAALSPKGRKAHYIWGWLQVSRVVNVDGEARRDPDLAWTRGHPHLSASTDPANTLYVAAERLELPGYDDLLVPGWGTFETAHPSLRLTAPDAKGVSDWVLPTAFLPGARPAMTFHTDADRWVERDGSARLRSVGRGQEFVLDLDLYPAVLPWLVSLLRKSGHQTTEPDAMTRKRSNHSAEARRETLPPARRRQALPFELQVRVFYRDRWLCHWCGRPVVFAPALKVLDGALRRRGWTGELAYFDERWRRDAAPMLDHLAAVIDHVTAFASNGPCEENNFVTSCNKCNARKNRRSVVDFVSTNPAKPVRGRYGEPTAWDGLVAVFLSLADRTRLTNTEERWREALLAHAHPDEVRPGTPSPSS